MIQIVELVHVILELKKDNINYAFIDSKLNCFNDVKKKYPCIDWDFLEDVREKTKEEINNWIDFCTKTVHVL